MSQSVITRAFVEWKAQQAVNNEPVTLDEFVFASVPDLDFTRPIPDTEGLPDEQFIVCRQVVNRAGVVNQNAVVYSVTLGADVGDFDFNWIGLVNRATGTLAAITHAPTQSKIKNASGQQGNVLTRSILMEFSNAQKETEISVPAETWQIDFTARLAGVDERQRIENIDIYGPAAFFGDSFLVTRSGSEYSITAGTGYVAGLRAVLGETFRIAAPKKPVRVWVDVTWKGSLVSVWGVETVITVAEILADYSDNGQQHYVFAVAEIAADGTITDLRPKGSQDNQEASHALAEHEKSRNHPDGTLMAKGFVSLSSSIASNSETVAATPKAVKAAMDNANGRYSQKGGVLDGGLEAKGDVTTISGNVCARANPDNKSGGAYIFQKIVNGAVVNTGSLISESDGGHLQINPSSLNCFIRFNGKTVSTHPDSYRIVSGNRGQFWRFDGSTLYLMFTREGDPYGTWSDLRPLMADYATGSLSCGGDFFAGSKVYSGNRQSYLGEDGNLYGPVWGGWLNNWVAARCNDAYNNAINWAYGNCVQDIRLGSSSEFQERGNNERMGGGVMTSFADRGSSNYWIRLRPLQKAVGGNWYTVGYQ